jgi:hypothetical protein
MDTDRLCQTGATTVDCDPRMRLHSRRDRAWWCPIGSVARSVVEPKSKHAESSPVPSRAVLQPLPAASGRLCVTPGHCNGLDEHGHCRAAHAGNRSAVQVVNGRRPTLDSLSYVCSSSKTGSQYCDAVTAGCDPQQTLAGLFCCVAQHSSLHARVRSST